MAHFSSKHKDIWTSVARQSWREEMIDNLLAKYAGRIASKKHLARVRYTKEDRAVIGAMHQDAQGNSELVADVFRKGGFSYLNASTVRRIMRNSV